MRKRILFISNLYPNFIYPNMATYNRQQIAALREHCDVEVISPIPWTTRTRSKLNNRVLEANEMNVYHPIYYYTPYVFRGWYGDSYYYSIKRVATQLLEKKHFDLIYSSWLYPDSWAAAKLARRFNLPLFVKVHGTDVNRLYPGTVVTQKSLDVAKQAETIICVSRALKERLIEFGVPAISIEVLYNGVDRSIFHQMDREGVRQRLCVGPDDYLVLYVGNLIKEKGLEELILSFKLLENNGNRKKRLVIIGSGTYDTAAKQLVTSQNLNNNVYFLGTQHLNTIAMWMNAASVLCLPSYMEGVPNVVLEALSCGTRIIASNVGGIPELNHGHGNMTLVQPRSVESLYDALADMLLNSLPHIRSDFINTWQENTKCLLDIFAGVRRVN